MQGPSTSISATSGGSEPPSRSNGLAVVALLGGDATGVEATLVGVLVGGAAEPALGRVVGREQVAARSDAKIPRPRACMIRVYTNKGRAEPEWINRGRTRQRRGALRRVWLSGNDVHAAAPRLTRPEHSRRFTGAMTCSSTRPWLFEPRCNRGRALRYVE